jgi:hypothetical protein
MHARWLLLLIAACSYTAPNDVTPSDGPLTDSGEDAPLPTDGPDPEVDSDRDGHLDSEDNCPAISNQTQADEDGDGVGNVCDNCPHVANADQDNSEEVAAGQVADAVGDACDPEPATGGNTIALFMPFDDATEINTWTGGGTNAAFSISGGKLRQTGDSDLAILFKNDLGLAEAFITTTVTYDTVDNAQQFRGVSLMTRFVRTGDFGHGVGCGEMRDSAVSGGAAFFDMSRFTGAGFQHIVHGAGASVAAGQTQTYTVHRVTGTTHECRIGAAVFTGALGIAEGDGSGINFAVYGVTASFAYVIAIL